MAPRRAEEPPAKRVAAPGCKLPMQLPQGEILTDITQNKWRIGHTIGYGGFGDIYLASKDIEVPVTEDAKYVVKIEPHNNGPLFVEMNFYIRAARKHMIESWCKSMGKGRNIGVPTYEGSGSHIYNGERYRFLVIPRYGVDIGTLFLNNGRKLPTKLVNRLAVQMLDALEYIHSRGYAHADVKGPNILLGAGLNGNPTRKSIAYLVDYGLAFRFRTAAGVHKPFVQDRRRAHEGTLEFTSRDAHYGTHSRRGDLETLGYNILQWLCGRLPWESENETVVPDPDEVHQQKEFYISNIPLLRRKCFPLEEKPPGSIAAYMEYVAELGFETKPNYAYLRSLFQKPEGNVPKCLYRFKESENISCYTPSKRPYLRERRPCRPVNGELRITRNMQPKLQADQGEFSWEKVLALHPDKLAKTQPTASPLTPPPSPPPPPPPPPLSMPTYAMLNVLLRMQEKRARSFRQRTLSKNAENAKPKRSVPIRQRSSSHLTKKPSSNLRNSPPLTRSRAARLKRAMTNHSETTKRRI